ncbi:MAG: hypothetical protein LUH18_01980 [Oscillospiraceae bacterium]|nr:hypothetical protein [Oscillospiraceae bacterium]
MQKFRRLLAVAAVLVLAISLLCVPVSAATVTINGTTYDVVYSLTGSYASGNWSTYTMDTAFINALNTDNAVLAFVRSSTVAAAEDAYDKFILFNTSYSGTQITLGTVASTIASEGEGSVTFDCLSDDGTVAMYDAKNVYNQWVANSLGSAGSPMLVSNSSFTYNITNIYVLAPEGSTGSVSYSVTVETATGGTVTSSGTEADAGDTVTLTVASDTSSSAAYRISELSVTDASGASVELTNNHDGTYTFTMPASNVTITPAFESSGYRYFYVNGVKIQDVLDYTVICGNGTAVFDPDSNTLTLTDATITNLASYSSSYLTGIYVAATSATAVPDGLTINLVGDNEITGTSGSKEYGIYIATVGANIVGVNDGTLTLNSVYDGLRFNTGAVSYTISNCTITATGMGNSAINAANGTGTTTISDSTITVSNSVRGIYATSALTISGCDIDLTCATSTAYGGIYSTNTSGGLTIADSTVYTTNTATGYSSLYARLFTVSGDTNIYAYGGYNTGKSYGTVNIYPTSGDEMTIYIGSSESAATAYGTYDEDTTITTGYTDLLYSTYAYFSVTTTVGEGNTTYKVSVSDSDNGSVSASKKSRIKPGETVTLTTSADEGYQLSYLVVTDASGNEVTLTDNGDGTYSFAMPESNVTVTAEFGYADGILYIFTGSDTFGFNFSDYLTDYSAGDVLQITATISGNNSAFNGCLGASDDVDGGWSQTDYTDSTGSTITLTVTASEDYPNGGGQFQCWGVYYGEGFYLNSISIVNLGGSNTGINRVIYINEEYHGIFYNGHLMSIPHTLDANGYCIVCGEYIGLATEEEADEEDASGVVEETVNIDEPVEGTDTETEDDSEEEEVAEVEEESNPTTGAMLALLPMAIAGLAVVISKK